MHTHCHPPQVCGCHPAIFGVILSAPSSQRMSDAFCPIARTNYASFVNSSVRLGGPVGPHWTLLHTLPTVAAEPINNVSGLFMGGSLAKAERLVEAGDAIADDVLFYSGYTAWRIDQLQAPSIRLTHRLSSRPPSMPLYDFACPNTPSLPYPNPSEVHPYGSSLTN
jgi:hypothetical protein